MGRNRRPRYCGLARGLCLFVGDEIRIVDLRALDLQIRLVSEITFTLDLGVALREFLDQFALLVRYLDFVSDKASA